MAERITEGVLLNVNKTGAGTSGTLTLVTEITSIDGPKESVSSLDKTALADSARKFRPGLYDGGEVTLTHNFDPANAEHSWLQQRVNAKTTNGYQILVPGEGSDPDFFINFDGFVTEHSVGFGGPDEFIEANVTIKVSGAVTFEEDS